MLEFDWYWGTFAFVSAIQCLWLAEFVLLSIFTGPLRQALGRLRANWQIGTKEEAERRTPNRVPEGDRLEDRHRRKLETDTRERTEAMLLGSLALAAWAVLVATTTTSLHAYSLDLLFLGAVLNITGPVAFRPGGIAGTYMGLEATKNAGSAAIGIAMLSALGKVFHASGLHYVAFAIVTVVAIRIALQTISDMRGTYQLLRRNPPATALPSVDTISAIYMLVCLFYTLVAFIGGILLGRATS